VFVPSFTLSAPFEETPIISIQAGLPLIFVRVRKSGQKFMEGGQDPEEEVEPDIVNHLNPKKIAATVEPKKYIAAVVS